MYLKNIELADKYRDSQLTIIVTSFELQVASLAYATQNNFPIVKTMFYLNNIACLFF